MLCDPLLPAYRHRGSAGTVQVLAEGPGLPVHTRLTAFIHVLYREMMDLQGHSPNSDASLEKSQPDLLVYFLASAEVSRTHSTLNFSFTLTISLGFFFFLSSSR